MTRPRPSLLRWATRRPALWLLAAGCTALVAVAASTVSARGALDCSGAQEYIVNDDQNVTTVVGQTNGASQTDGYSCVTWPESGSEYIVLLDVTTALLLHATLTSTADLDLFLLSDCHSDSCLVATNREFMVEIPGGSYVLVIDSDQGGELTFSLDLEGLPVGVPLQACAAAKPLACSEAGVEIIGNVFEQDAFVVYADCSPILEYGTERWHSLELPAGGSLQVTLAMPQADGALWLFEGCGPSATCVAFSDQSSTGGNEELDFTNGSGADHTYYLVVDTFRPVESETAGAFTLHVTCPGVTPTGHIPPEIAELTEPLLCEGTTLSLGGNLYNTLDLLTTASCGAFATGGGEHWFALTLADNATLTITLDGMLFDGALWLFDGCGPDASCVAFADDLYESGNPLGHVEVLEATKMAGGGHTYYLAVDTVQDTSTQDEAFWNFNITIECGTKAAFGYTPLDALRSPFRHR